MRNRYLDLLRFLAIVRVVVYHVTGWATLTLVFPAMSVMFALAGSLMAASLDRSGAAGGRAPAAPPAAVALGARGGLRAGHAAHRAAADPEGAALAVPVADPPANGWGALALSVIWYLRDYLWFVLASPVALWLFRRAPLPTLLAPYVLLVAIEFGLLPAAPTVLREFGLYFGAWLLGFAHHDGLLRRLANRVLVAGGARPRRAPAAPGSSPTPARAATTSTTSAWATPSGRRRSSWCCSAGRRPARTGWTAARSLGRAVTVLNRRALTVYLWHMPFVWRSPRWSTWSAGRHQDPLGLAIRVVLVFALVGLVTLLVGWVEDVAARRPPELVPGGPLAPAGAPRRRPPPRPDRGRAVAVGPRPRLGDRPDGGGRRAGAPRSPGGGPRPGRPGGHRRDQRWLTVHVPAAGAEVEHQGRGRVVGDAQVGVAGAGAGPHPVRGRRAPPARRPAGGVDPRRSGRSSSTVMLPELASASTWPPSRRAGDVAGGGAQRADRGRPRRPPRCCRSRSRRVPGRRRRSTRMSPEPT